MWHNGGGFGHYSELELYPDMQLGIAMSLSGQEGGAGLKDLIAMFVGMFPLVPVK